MLMAAKSWLCRDDMDRQRLLDMDERIGPVRRMSIGVIALALVACGPWLGWWTLIPLALAAGAFQVAERFKPRVERPEYLLFGGVGPERAGHRGLGGADRRRRGADARHGSPSPW